MNYFQHLAAKYDAWFTTPHGQYVYRYEREIIMDLADIRDGGYVADIGCGTGIYTGLLCAAGARVVGVDISPEMLAIAADKNTVFGDRASFVEADAAALPFADGTFDMVISVTALEFFKDPKACLHEMYRVLRPGGHMVVAVLNSLSLWAAERRIKTWIAETVFSHANFYSIANLQKMLLPYKITQWHGGIFIPPFAPDWLINNPDRFERWGQQYVPSLGALIAVRVDK